MLQELERKLATVVADAVDDRPHLDVSVAAGPGAPPAAGRAIALVGLTSVAPDPGFERARVSFGGGEDAPSSQRVLPVRFVARIAFALRPEAGAAAVAAGRATLLEDISRVGHALDADDVRSGAALRSTGDAGYDVQRLDLARALLDAAAEPGDDDLLRGELGYDGRATLWPPGAAGPEGVTRAVDVTLAPVPLGLAADDPVVRAGGSTRVRIRGVSGSRLADLTAGDREQLRLAVAVRSDLPADQRGRIIGGAAGTTTGARIVPVEAPETVITYDAPAGDLGSTRVEHVEIRLASREGDGGVVLGSLAIALEPAG